MVLRMASPTRRTDSDNWYYRRTIPADIRPILLKRPKERRPRGWYRTHISISLGTADRAAANTLSWTWSRRHALISPEVHSRMMRSIVLRVAGSATSPDQILVSVRNHIALKYPSQIEFMPVENRPQCSILSLHRLQDGTHNED